MKTYLFNPLYLILFSPLFSAEILIGNILFNAPTSLASLTIANSLDPSYNTGLHCYTKTTLSSPLIEYNVTILMIGNYDKQTKMFFPSLPIIPAPPTKLQYLMTTKGNNNMLYIGVDDSPNPPPDFYIIPYLKVNDVYGNYTELLINILGGTTIIGNSTNTTTIVANQLNITNTNEKTQNKEISTDQYLVTFSSPVTFENNVTISNDILINGDMNFTGKNPFLVNSGFFTHNLTVNNQAQFGRIENDSIIMIEGAFQANGDVFLGTPILPITTISNIPTLSNITPGSYYYLLVNKNTNKITKGPTQDTSIITEDIIHKSRVNVDFINETNTANTIFHSSNIQFNYTNTIFSGNLYLSNSALLGTMFFGNCLFDPTVPIILSGNSSCNITGNTILLDNSYHKALYTYGQITLPLIPTSTTSGISQGVINKTSGLLYQLPFNTNNSDEVKQDLKSIEYTVSEHKEVIDYYRKKIQEIKTTVKFLLTLSKKEILRKMKLRHILRGTIL